MSVEKICGTCGWWRQSDKEDDHCPCPISGRLMGRRETCSTWRQDPEVVEHIEALAGQVGLAERTTELAKAKKLVLGPLPGTEDNTGPSLADVSARFMAKLGPHTATEVMAKGTKHDAGKPPLSMLPRGGLEACAEVMRFGAEKYTRDNWRGGFEDSRLIDASLRHLTALMNGEREDPESGLNHVGHAIFSLMVLAEQYRVRAAGREMGVDDLPNEKGENNE